MRTPLVNLVSRSALLLALLLGSPSPASAATLTVTDFGDSGAPGQLRTLINSAGGNDTIVIEAGTITLTGTAGEDVNAGGDLDIVKSLTIQGAGQGVTIIDGGGNDRVIDVRPGAGTVNLSNLTIRNGVASGGGAGIRVGILNAVALANVTVSDNTATSLDGGGISNSSDLTLTNVTLNGNKTTGFLGRGGAISNNIGTLTVTTSTLSGNTASNGDGGAINNSDTMTVTTSTLSGNTANRDGGAIENTGTLTLNNVTLSGNTASGGGGAIENLGTLTVTSSTLRLNTAGSDGGCIRNFLGGDVTLTNSTLELNSAAGILGGGCIHNFNAGSTVTLNNSALLSNQADGDGAGGGINNGTDGTVTLTNVTLFGNRATGLGGGGGISNSGGNVTLTNVTIFANVATAFPFNGGGIENSGSGSTVTLTNTLVSFNRSDPSGNTPSNCATTLGATITSLGHNFDTGTTCAFAGPGDISDLNPKQEALLLDNGGPTPTFALLPGSLAVDAGTNAGCPPTDQRGFRRPVDGDSNGTATCDIGAFELVTVATSGAASVLPTERAGLVGGPAVTAFGNLFNLGLVTATGCAIAPFTPVPATFTYQTTTAQNQLTGTANTPANIPASGVQNFVFAFAPTAPFPLTEVQLSFACTNSTPAPITSGVNTFRLGATATPASDIVAIALTPSGDGIVRLASTGVFVVATANVGAPGLITATANTGAASLPVTITLCETDPVTSVCLAPPSPSVQTQIATNATPTFGVFVTNTGPIPFDPANSRIQVHLEGGGGGGGTGVAVCTQPLCP